MSARTRATPKRSKPRRAAAITAAWREVIRRPTPRRHTSARLVLDALLLDAMVGRLEREIVRALELATDAGKITERAGTLIGLLEKRIAELDQLAKTKTSALN